MVEPGSTPREVFGPVKDCTRGFSLCEGDTDEVVGGCYGSAADAGADGGVQLGRSLRVVRLFPAGSLVLNLRAWLAADQS